MGDDVFPPLRVKEADNDPNIIPVFVISFTNTIITRLGPGQIQVNPVGSSGGAGASEAFITYSAGNTIDNERILTAGSSVTTFTDATNFYVNAITAGFATSGATFITYQSEASLASSRVLRAGSSVTVASDATNFYVTALTPVFTTLPIQVGSGGTALTSILNRAIMIGSGTFAVDTMPALTYGELVIGSSTVLRPFAFGTGSVGQYIVTSGGTNFGLAWVNTVGAGGVVYAPTAGTYITYQVEAALGSSRVLKAGSSVTVASDGSNFYITAVTAGFTPTGRTISTTYPLAGGGDFTIDRTHTVDTAFLVTSARTVTAGTGLIGGGNLGTDISIAMSVPVVVSSGGTGATALTNRGILIGSGTAAIGALAPMSAGALLVGSGVAFAPTIFNSGGAGTFLISTQGVPNALAWIGTAGAGASATVNTREIFHYTTPFFLEADTANPVWQWNVGTAGTLAKALATVTLAPSSQNIIWDVRRNGATVWTVTANRLNITSATLVGSSLTFNTASVVENDVLALYVMQVGSTSVGGNWAMFALVTT